VADETIPPRLARASDESNIYRAVMRKPNNRINAVIFRAA